MNLATVGPCFLKHGFARAFQTSRKQRSGVDTLEIWGGAKNFGVAKMFDFRRTTLFCCSFCYSCCYFVAFATRFQIKQIN